MGKNGLERAGRCFPGEGCTGEVLEDKRGLAFEFAPEVVAAVGTVTPENR